MRGKLVASEYDDNMADKHLTTIQPMFRRSAVCGAPFIGACLARGACSKSARVRGQGQNVRSSLSDWSSSPGRSFFISFFFYLRIFYNKIPEYFLFTNTFYIAFTSLLFFLIQIRQGVVNMSINNSHVLNRNKRPGFVIYNYRKKISKTYLNL